VGRERLRVLLVEFGKPDPAAVPLGRVLRDEGMEVVHAGPLDTLEQLRSTAEQEDPDAVGVLGDGPPPGLAEALNGVRVFAGGDPGKAVEWLRGGRSHTVDVPSDRAR
jgi:methylmalonyl-CoA mutase C-terminal domain/subunit